MQTKFLILSPGKKKLQNTRKMQVKKILAIYYARVWNERETEFKRLETRTRKAKCTMHGYFVKLRQNREKKNKSLSLSLFPSEKDT